MNIKSKNEKGSLCIFSYNSRGFTEEKQDIVKLLFVDTDEYYPIVCNQENFLLKGNRYKIKQCLPNSKIIFKPATKEGRPKQGRKAETGNVYRYSSRTERIGRRCFASS